MTNYEILVGLLLTNLTKCYNMTIEIRANKSINDFNPDFKYTSSDVVIYKVNYLGGDSFIITKSVKPTVLSSIELDIGIVFLGSTNMYTVTVTE